MMGVVLESVPSSTDCCCWLLVVVVDVVVVKKRNGKSTHQMHSFHNKEHSNKRYYREELTSKKPLRKLSPVFPLFSG